MTVRTHFDPYSEFVWKAYDTALADKHLIGCGATEAEALADLERLLREMAEWEEDEACRPR